MLGETRKTVLIVDDDELVLIHLEALLQDEGYETTTAWGGRQAVESLCSKKFDLVLLDDYLPDTGTEVVLKHIQRLALPPLTAVMQSSQPSPDLVPRLAPLGVREVVHKRMPQRQFSDVVRAWLTPAAPACA